MVKKNIPNSEWRYKNLIDKGAVGFIKYIVSLDGYGFLDKLHAAGIIEYGMENLVNDPRFSILFSDEEKKIASEKLKRYPKNTTQFEIDESIIDKNKTLTELRNIILKNFERMQEKNFPNSEWRKKTLDMKGPVGFVKYIVNLPGAGFLYKLKLNDIIDCAMEKLVLDNRFSFMFSDADKKIASEKLNKYK